MTGLKKIGGKIAGQIGNYISNQFKAEDKQENRAKTCFDSLEEADIKMCNVTTRKVVTNIAQTLEKDKSYKYDVNHCLKAFEKIGLVNCNTLPKESKTKTKINSNICLDILKINDVELCFNSSGVRCAESKFWEEKINWTDQKPVELCKELFNKHSLVVCDDNTFDVSKCLNVFEKNNTKLYHKNNKWFPITQETFDKFCCANEKNAPFCDAFSVTKEFSGEYNVENCEKELAGLDVHSSSNHEEL